MFGSNLEFPLFTPTFVHFAEGTLSEEALLVIRVVSPNLFLSDPCGQSCGREKRGEMAEEQVEDDGEEKTHQNFNTTFGGL